HGFFCNERESYHADSAKDAWEKFKSFFAQHLK
ncbi:MAG: dienelactone hydrolase family protein, partial [Candidatus Binatota bacterium]